MSLETIDEKVATWALRYLNNSIYYYQGGFQTEEAATRQLHSLAQFWNRSSRGLGTIIEYQNGVQRTEAGYRY